MTKKHELYKCDICGNMIEVVLSGMGELVCCGKPMELIVEKTDDGEFTEKHVPIFHKCENGDTLIRVGTVEHPMHENHYIQFIEVFAGNGLLRKYLTPAEKPEFLIKLKNNLKHAREYCNLHGLWKGENDAN